MTTNKTNKRALGRVLDYQHVFGTPEGRRVLYDLMGNHGLLSSGFSKDPYDMARMAGERNVVVRILTILNVEPKKLQRMMEEADELAKADIV